MRVQENIQNIFKAKKYIRLYSELIQVFSTARSQGRCADFNCLWSKARKINREVLKDDRVIKKHVISFNSQFYQEVTSLTSTNLAQQEVVQRIP